MAGQWEPANGNSDESGGFFGDVDGIVFSDKDSGPAELRYKGGAADIYDDVPDDTPAPSRRMRRSEGVWSPDSKDAKPKKKAKSKTSRKFLARVLPLFTVALVFGVIAALLWGVAGLLGAK